MFSLSGPPVDQAPTKTEAAEAQPFGLTIHEFIHPVLGFRIWIDDKQNVATIENVVDPEALDEPQYFQSPGNYVFWLMENEWITRVSYCLLPATEMVCGIGFDTNLRQAQWVGTRTAVERSLTPPSGYCVSSLRGRKKDVWGYSEIGAVYRKRVDVATLTSMRVQLEDKWVVRKPQQSGDSVGGFRSIVTEDTVGAVLLTVSDTVDKIEMLSSATALSYRPWRGHLSLARGEHLMELLWDERITGVNCKQNYGRVCAIRVVTTRRVTPWYGRCPRKGEDTLMVSAAVTCGNDPGASIAGVFGSKSSSSSCLSSLGVVIATPVNKVVVEAPCWLLSTEDY